MENNTEIFTDEMNEEELIEAFNKETSKTEEVEPSTEEVIENLEQPTEEVNTEEVSADTQPEVETALEESTSDIIDFSKGVTLKDRDLELPINSSKELLDLANKGLNFTRKTQDFAKHKPTLDYMEAHGITLDKLQTYAEAESGSADALGQIAKQSKIDPLDIDINTQYTPNQDFSPSQQSETDIFASELQHDTATANEFRRMMDYVPDSFKSTLGSDINTLRGFTNDVRSGVADKLLPEAVKMHALNGGDFVQSYIEAGNRYYAEQEVPVQESAPTPQPKQVSENRAKAGISSSSGTSSNSMEFDTWGSDDATFLQKINELSRN